MTDPELALLKAWLAGEPGSGPALHDYLQEHGINPWVWQERPLVADGQTAVWRLNLSVPAGCEDWRRNWKSWVGSLVCHADGRFTYTVWGLDQEFYAAPTEAEARARAENDAWELLARDVHESV